MEINSLLYFSCLLVLPICTNSMVVTITGTFPERIFSERKNFKAKGEYKQGTVERLSRVKIHTIIEPPNLTLTQLKELLQTPLTVLIRPDEEQTTFEVTLQGRATICTFPFKKDVVQVGCKRIHGTKSAATPAVAKCMDDNNRFVGGTKFKSGGLLVVTKLTLFKFTPESVPTEDSNGDFNLSLSSGDASSYAALLGIICEYWDSGTDWQNIEGKNLTPIQIKAGRHNLIFVINEDVEIHLRLHLTYGNIILVDAFKRNSKEIWVFEGCLTSIVLKGQEKAKKIGIRFYSYVTTVGLSANVGKLSFAPSKHGDTLGSIEDPIEISKLKIERPQEYREQLTILKWE